MVIFLWQRPTSLRYIVGSFLQIKVHVVKSFRFRTCIPSFSFPPAVSFSHNRLFLITNCKRPSCVPSYLRWEIWSNSILPAVQTQWLASPHDRSAAWFNFTSRQYSLDRHFHPIFTLRPSMFLLFCFANEDNGFRYRIQECMLENTIMKISEVCYIEKT